MSISDFFKKLGAPLVNKRWSWGAVRPSDGAVFLRVWQDRRKKIDGKWHMKVTNNEKYQDDPGDPGHKERLEHVRLVREGSACFMVMCRAKDIDASPREIAEFDSDLFVGDGQPVEALGEWWLAWAGRQSVKSTRT